MCSHIPATVTFTVVTLHPSPSKASEASGIARKAQVKLAALKPTAASAPAILEIYGPLDRAAAACYFVQLQLWLDSTLGKSRA